MIDFTRRRFLFGLAAAPLVVPAVKHFVMPRWEPEVPVARLMTITTAEKIVNPPITWSAQGSYDGKTWHDLDRASVLSLSGGISFEGAWKADKGLRNVRLLTTYADRSIVTAAA